MVAYKTFEVGVWFQVEDTLQVVLAGVELSMVVLGHCLAMGHAAEVEIHQAEVDRLLDKDFLTGEEVEVRGGEHGGGS